MTLLLSTETVPFGGMLTPATADLEGEVQERPEQARDEQRHRMFSRSGWVDVPGFPGRHGVDGLRGLLAALLDAVALAVSHPGDFSAGLLHGHPTVGHGVSEPSQERALGDGAGKERGVRLLGEAPPVAPVALLGE